VKQNKNWLKQIAIAIDSASAGMGAVRKSLRRFYRETTGVVIDVLTWLVLLAVAGAQCWSYVQKIW
jgi:hypothetical protein